MLRPALESQLDDMASKKISFGPNFHLRTVLEKYLEMRKDLFSTHMDLEKAYDWVD